MREVAHALIGEQWTVGPRGRARPPRGMTRDSARSENTIVAFLE